MSWLTWPFLTLLPAKPPPLQVDSHVPRLAACIRDPNELVRTQALALLANLLQKVRRAGVCVFPGLKIWGLMGLMRCWAGVMGMEPGAGVRRHPWHACALSSRTAGGALTRRAVLPKAGFCWPPISQDYVKWRGPFFPRFLLAGPTQTFITCNPIVAGLRQVAGAALPPLPAGADRRLAARAPAGRVPVGRHHRHQGAIFQSPQACSIGLLLGANVWAD